jgi:hypothetical protein
VQVFSNGNVKFHWALLPAASRLWSPDLMELRRAKFVDRLEVGEAVP